MIHKPYRSVPIEECGEPMVLLPYDTFAFTVPHPYVAAGAPYGKASPWMLRQSIVASLVLAQEKLATIRPGWKIKFVDAFRPNEVQAFMVERAFDLEAKALGIDRQKASPEERERLETRVFSLWGVPSDDPDKPPPHKTGAAFDCTLVNENGEDVFMGTEVDDNSPLAYPNAFASDTSPQGQLAHAHRQFLKGILEEQGFVQHKSEWWHFSRGDQLAAWISARPGMPPKAIYGHAKI